MVNEIGYLIWMGFFFCLGIGVGVLIGLSYAQKVLREVGNKIKEFEFKLNNTGE